MGTRQQIEPTDDWQQLDLLVRSPEQRTYEIIRPVVLFGRSPAERARQTGAPHVDLSCAATIAIVHSLRRALNHSDAIGWRLLR